LVFEHLAPGHSDVSEFERKLKYYPAKCALLGKHLPANALFNQEDRVLLEEISTLLEELVETLGKLKDREAVKAAKQLNVALKTAKSETTANSSRNRRFNKIEKIGKLQS
jgi:hypothetical protein